MNTDQLIALAVWERKIDGLYTREIANKFQISTSKALRILTKISLGGYVDKHHFIYDEMMCGVIISDGSTFCRNNEDAKHSYWFCT